MAKSTKSAGSAQPSAVERRFVDLQLMRLRDLESRTRGEYAECLIVDALGRGAHLADSAVSSWDICWNGVTIAVRCTGSWNSETLAGAKTGKPSPGGWSFTEKSTWGVDDRWSGKKLRVWTDVVVLAFHGGTTIDDGWRFYVIPGSAVNDLNVSRISPARAAVLAPRGAAVELSELRKTVKEIPAAVRKGKSLFPTRCDRVGHGA